MADLHEDLRPATAENTALNVTVEAAMAAAGAFGGLGVAALLLAIVGAASGTAGLLVFVVWW